jgi:ABC-type lipoprotein release transport system permease subunit
MATLLRIAWRSLWRGWRRSAIVVTAVTVGLVACLFLVSFSNAFVEELISTAVETRLANVSVMAPGYARNPDVQRNVPGNGVIAAVTERFPGAHASPRLLGDGLIQSARKSSRIALAGVEPERESLVSVVGRSFVAGGWPAPVSESGARRLGEVALGDALAELLGVRVGDKVVIHTPGESGLGAFRVSGIFHTASSSFDKTQVFVRLGEAQRLLEVPGRVTEVALALDDPDRAPELAAFARAELSRALPGVDLDVLTWREREPRLAAMLELMANTRWIAYAAVFIGMAFGIANALLMAVYERIREFGVLRSLGLPASQLVWLVLLESLMLTLGGAALGLALGVPLVTHLGKAGLDLSRFSAGLNEFGIGAVLHLRLNPGDLVSPLYIALVTALVAAAWPAWKAARLRPAEALRHV